MRLAGFVTAVLILTGMEVIAPAQDAIARKLAILERPEREAFQKPKQVMAALALRPGERVADSRPFGCDPKLDGLSSPQMPLHLWLATLAVGGCLVAGDDPRSLEARPGKTPVLDGVISPGEWEDATIFLGVEGWRPQFSAVTDPQDLSLKGYVKHDGKRLYFAFDVTDDVLYGIDTPRWLPPNNPKAHDLTRAGFPWFGDEIELLINASNRWVGNQESAGNGSSWQMVCNLTKSRKGGIGAGGLLEGEPRRSADAWRTYQGWILSGAQECAAKPKPGGRGYIIEWAVSFNPCLEVEPGVFYSTAMGDRAMGLNILIGDLDASARGTDNPYGFHHENSFAGSRNTRTQPRDFGTLWIRVK